MQTGIGRGKFLNSKVADAEAAEDQAIEQERTIAALEVKVKLLADANEATKDLVAATSQALEEAYATLQSQAVEIAMLQRKLSMKIIVAGSAGALDQVLGDSGDPANGQ